MKAKGLQAMGIEIGMTHLGEPIVLGTDSSAAKSVAARRGLGRMRHMDVCELWLQEEVLCRRVVLVNIPGVLNPADLMTK